MIASTKINFEEKGILITPLVLIWRTEKLDRIYQKFASPKLRIFWIRYGNISSFISLLIFFILPIILLINLVKAILNNPSPIFLANNIQIITVEMIILIIPALFVSLLLHELMHAIMASSEGIKIEKTGIMLIIAFFTTFIQFTTKELNQLSNRGKFRILGVGITTNLILAIILIPFLYISFSLISPFYDDSQGALIIGVEPDSPAEKSNLQRGDVIISIKIIEFQKIVNYYPITSNLDLINYLRNVPAGNPFVIETLDANITITGKTPSTNSVIITGSDIGVYAYDFKPSHTKYLSKFLPYWLETEIRWLININLFLGLYNLLPLPFTDGNKILDTLIESLSLNKMKIIKTCQIIAAFLLIGNIIVTN